MRVRTDRAKHLLRSYDLKLDDIAARCGYRDTAYFCRVFKRLAKMTAADYRAMCQPGPRDKNTIEATSFPLPRFGSRGILQRSS